MKKGFAEAMRKARESKKEEPESKSGGGLISMKRDKKEKKSYGETMASPMQEDYSYATRINLGKEELDKLDMESLPKIGSKMRLVADVEVVSVSTRAGKNDDSRDMGLQITAMKLE
jgi:hypothetical protein